MALNGLHLRRAELARDCVQKNIKDASISESILGDDEVRIVVNITDENVYHRVVGSLDSHCVLQAQ